MHYDLVIEDGKEEAIIRYLKRFKFVTVRKKRLVRKKTTKRPAFSYFGAMPDWNINLKDLRKKKLRKSPLQW